MKVLKIRDSYLFDGNPKKSHWCLVYESERSSKPYIRELTHIYRPDPIRFDQIKKGIVVPCKVKGFDVPSGAYPKSYGCKSHKYTDEGIWSNVVDSKPGKGWWKKLNKKK